MCGKSAIKSVRSEYGGWSFRIYSESGRNHYRSVWDRGKFARGSIWVQTAAVTVDYRYDQDSPSVRQLVVDYRLETIARKNIGDLYWRTNLSGLVHRLHQRDGDDSLTRVGLG